MERLASYNDCLAFARERDLVIRPPDAVTLQTFVEKFYEPIAANVRKSIEEVTERVMIIEPLLFDSKDPTHISRLMSAVGELHKLVESMCDEMIPQLQERSVPGSDIRERAFAMEYFRILDDQRGVERATLVGHEADYLVEHPRTLSVMIPNTERQTALTFPPGHDRYCSQAMDLPRGDAEQMYPYTFWSIPEDRIEMYYDRAQRHTERVIQTYAELQASYPFFGQQI